MPMGLDIVLKYFSFPFTTLFAYIDTRYNRLAPLDDPPE